MKKMFLLVFLQLFLQSCKKENAKDCESIWSDETNLSDVAENLVGKWNLTLYIAYKAIQKQPNIQLQFTRTKTSKQYDVEVFEDNNRIGSVTINAEESKLENENVVAITSVESLIFNNGRTNFLSGKIRICKDQLIIDQGGQFDAPVYTFKKE